MLWCIVHRIDDNDNQLHCRQPKVVVLLITYLIILLGILMNAR